jgi:ABC-type transport system substrate-binding protein
MTHPARSGFVMVSLGALVALGLFNTAQLHNLEALTIENQRQIKALEAGVPVREGGAPAAAAAATQIHRYVPSPEEAAALADPANLLKPRRKHYINAPSAVRAPLLKRQIAQDPRGLNPYIANGADAAELAFYFNDALAEADFDDPDRYFPLLALKVTSDDGLTYRVQLRPGVWWHLPTVDWEGGAFDWLKGEGPDGRHELTADDYLFVFDMLQNEQVAGRISSLRPYFSALKEARSIDRYTFEVQFTEKLYTNLPMLLSLQPAPRWLFRHDPDGQPYDDATWGLKLNEHWYNQKAIGVGRYRFLSWEQGVKIEMEADDRYWGGPVPFDRVQAVMISDQNAWPRKLKAGELDYTQIQPEQYASEIKGNTTGVYLGEPRIKQAVHGESGYFYIGWNLDKPLFADKRVRTALALAFDRPRLLESVFHSLGELTSGPFSQDSDCYDRGVAPLPFDLARARALLDEAGWTDSDGDGVRDKQINGQKVDFAFTLLTYGGSTEYETLASVYREDLLSIGVRMNPSALEWSTMLKKMDERDFDAYTGAWVLSHPVDLMQIWHSAEADKPKSSNRIGFRNPEADRIAEALRSTFDKAERTALCHSFHRLIADEQPYAFFFQRKRAVLYWDHMNNWEFNRENPYRDLRRISFHALPTAP